MNNTGDTVVSENTAFIRYTRKHMLPWKDDTVFPAYVVESSLNVMAHGDAREGKWRGNRRMERVASTLHTTSEYGVSSITAVDTHTSAASSRLNWRLPADLNGTVRFAERRNLVSARVPSLFNWPLPSRSRSRSMFHWYSQHATSPMLHACKVR